MQSMSGAKGIITWAWRGPGHTAETSNLMSHSYLSSIAARLVLSFGKKPSYIAYQGEQEAHQILTLQRKVSV
jgi:hypothetical protein